MFTVRILSRTSLFVNVFYCVGIAQWEIATSTFCDFISSLAIYMENITLGTGQQMSVSFTSALMLPANNFKILIRYIYLFQFA